MLKNGLQVILATLVLVLILAGVFALAWHGTIPGGEAIAVITTVLGLVGGAFAVHSGVSAGATAAATPIGPGSSPTPPPPVNVSLQLDGKELASHIAEVFGAEARKAA